MYVNDKGEVYAVAGGSAIIYVSNPSGVFASCLVTVEVDVESISMRYHELSLSNDDGESMYTLRVELLPANATNKTVTWTSTNENVVRVDENGTVTFVSCGHALVRATTHNGLVEECLIYCHVSDGKNAAFWHHIDDDYVCRDCCKSFDISNLQTLKLPKALTTIDANAFSGTVAEAVIIPDTVETVHEYAFVGCYNLAYVVVPEGFPAEIFRGDLVILIR